MVSPAVGTEVLAQGGGSQNFLLPNGTFFFELILFALVFFLISRFIVPPIRKALADREERVRRTQQDKEKAEEAFAKARERHDEVVSEARAAGSSIRDEARASARSAAAERRAEIEREAAEARSRGDRELEEQRSRVRGDLRAALPDLSRTLAERILGRTLSDDDRVRSTVDEYLGSLEDTSGGSAPHAGVGTAQGSAAAGSEDR